MATRKPVQLSPEALHRIREAARTWFLTLGGNFPRQSMTIIIGLLPLMISKYKKRA